jgi:hypothetical protein
MYRDVILSICFLYFFGDNISAQTYDLKFNSINSDQSNYDVQVQIRSGSVFKLAASNITFDYNTAAISNPSLLNAQNYSGVGGSPLHIYSDMTVTQPNDGIASVNITYTQPNDTYASNVLTDWTDVCIIRFNIIDPDLSSNLIFRTSGLSPTTIYKIEGSTLTLLSPGDLYPLNEPMPVELINFSASIVNRTVELKWITATEINNYGFEIEKSEVRNQKSEWKTIGFVNGYGNSNSTKDYSFMDANPSFGKVQYRLKQIDNDGKYEYSKVVEVTLNSKPIAFELHQNFPNPFNPTTSIRFSLPEASRLNLSIYNALGELVLVLEDKFVEAGNYQKEFNADNLSSGIYIYRLTANNQVISRKMNLLK